MMPNIKYLRWLWESGRKGQLSVDNIISLVIIIFVFAVCYPVIDSAINTLQNQAGTSVDLISAAYLPIMAIMVIGAIMFYSRPYYEQPRQ